MQRFGSGSGRGSGLASQAAQLAAIWRSAGQAGWLPGAPHVACDALQLKQRHVAPGALSQLVHALHHLASDDSLEHDAGSPARPLDRGLRPRLAALVPQDSSRRSYGGLSIASDHRNVLQGPPSFASLPRWSAARALTQPPLSHLPPGGWRAFQSSPARLAEVRQTNVSREECDRLVAELRYRNIRVPQQLDISWGRRLQNFAASLVGMARSTVKFFASIPGRLNSARKMSLTEWRQMLSGWWTSLKHEAHHYWVGFKLFGFEVRVASRLVWKQLHGSALTRRERKQLTRTTADIFRMVPFTMFIIIPFAEFLLPVALTLFPNMLPSTFQTQLKQEEDMKKLLKLKTELARFLQQTVGELAKDVRTRGSDQAAADAKMLYNFLKDVRAGAQVDNEDIIRFSRLFNDELTLDNLDRVHLVTLCQFLQLNYLGTAEFLRMRLRAHLNEVKADDYEIQSEGVDELTDDELRQACRARGMPAPFGTGCTSFMRAQLRDWLELSLEKQVPQSLLLLSRAFKIRTASPVDKSKKKDPTEVTVEGLKETFNMLPEETIEDVEMETFKSTTSMEKRLEWLRRVEQDIKEENETAEVHEAERRKLEESRKRLDVVQANARAAATAVLHSATASALRDTMQDTDKSLLAEGESEEEQRYKTFARKEERMAAILRSLAVLASASGVSEERSLFMQIATEEVKQKVLQMEQPSAEGSYLEFLNGKLISVRPHSEVENRSRNVVDHVSSRVHNMLVRLEEDLDRYDEKIGQRMHLLDRDNDGMITHEELREALKFLGQELSEDEMETLMGLLESSAAVEGENKFRVDALSELAETNIGKPSAESGESSRRASSG